MFENARTFYEAVEKKLPGLVVLDIMLPDEDGLSVVKTLRERKDTKKLPILLVTAKASEIDKVKGLDLGADDYLTKPFGVMELISRVKALLRRSGAGSEQDSYEAGAIFLDQERHAVFVDNKRCELTYKEYELLKMLMKNVGTVIRREDILEQVWGVDFEGESRTLDMHIKTLRQKLGDAGAQIQTVRNVGYILE